MAGVLVSRKARLGQRVSFSFPGLDFQNPELFLPLDQRLKCLESETLMPSKMRYRLPELVIFAFVDQ